VADSRHHLHQPERVVFSDCGGAVLPNCDHSWNRCLVRGVVMTPIQTWQFLVTTKLDLKAWMILELLSKCQEKTMMTDLVNEASRTRLSSPATTYKCIAALRKRGLAAQKKYANQDERITYINITEKGRTLLEEWGK
jgi:DNA-binding MarR family transcriptional regulator